MKFVIVEDEIRIREGIRKLLPKISVNNTIVGEAENGEEGIEVIKRANPDVIITDIRMPIMDGLEMLKKLYAQGCNAKAIVLSAYSEFEYARQAIRLGVTEYLLKPIDVQELFRAVQQVTQDKEKEIRQKPAQIGTPDQVFKSILNGDLKLEKEVVGYMVNQMKVKEDMELSILVAYFEEWEEERTKKIYRAFRSIMAENQALSYSLLEDAKQKRMQLIIYGYEESHAARRRIQNHFLAKKESFGGIALGWTHADNIFMLKSSYDALEPYMDWNISFGDKIIVSYPEIKNVQTALCVYPVEIENEIKVAICVNDYEEIEKKVQEFHKYFQNDKVYEAKKIKECYVRFFWAVINFFKDVGGLDAENIEQQVLLERIMQSKTMEGLKSVTTELMEKINRKKADIENINVKRAVAMIHEFYRMGITLEEIALKLGITPEYLGTQFHQEMGVNFSAYIKGVRINKAKELLLGTNLKMYQIAERVGYSDPKYFSRVFKAETGQLPAEYRKTRK